MNKGSTWQERLQRAAGINGVAARFTIERDAADFQRNVHRTEEGSELLRVHGAAEHVDEEAEISGMFTIMFADLLDEWSNNGEGLVDSVGGEFERMPVEVESRTDGAVGDNLLVVVE